MRTLFTIILVVAGCISLLAQDAEKVIRTVETDGYGQLWEKIEREYETIDSLVVRGPISQPDFEAMWKASFYGRLSGIDLSKAQPEGAHIPDTAFYNAELQNVESGESHFGKFLNIALNYITLPEDLESIGKGAFYSTHLRSIELPPSLRSIGAGVFSNCYYLKGDPLIIPEGVEEIPVNCFNSASALSRIILPKTVKVIKTGAFEEAFSLLEVEMQPGLEVIEEVAFMGCYDLERMILPNTVTELGKDNFIYLNKLKELKLSDAMTTVDLTVTFGGPYNLEKLILPKYLESLSGNVFEGFSEVEMLIFPETLKELDAFYWMPGLKKVYAHGTMPALTTDRVFEKLHEEAILYVPVGAGDIYRTAQGWRNFANIVESDDMPGVGVEAVTADKSRDGRMYDVMGREIRNPQPGTIYIQNGRKFIAR